MGGWSPDDRAGEKPACWAQGLEPRVSPLVTALPAPCPCSANTVGSFNRQCLSCDLVDNCAYFSASFSPSADFFLLKCEGEFCHRVTPLSKAPLGPGRSSEIPGQVGPPSRGRRRSQEHPSCITSARCVTGILHLIKGCSLPECFLHAVPVNPKVHLHFP